MKRRLAIAAFFFVSFASLVYQVAWLRLLIKIFGSSVYAVSTLVTSFMAGLALGSYLIGKYIDSNKRPLDFFGMLLCSIGTVGFLSFYGFEPLSTFSIVLFQIFSESFLFHEIQFLLAFLIMIVPTSLIGGVYPVINKILVRSDVGWDVGLIYSANNLAAALGSIIAAFFLISTLGVNKTIISISILVIAFGTLVLLSEEGEK